LQGLKYSISHFNIEYVAPMLIHQYASKTLFNGMQ